MLAKNHFAKYQVFNFLEYIFKLNSTETCIKLSNPHVADSPTPIKTSQLYPSTSETPPSSNHLKQDPQDPIPKPNSD